MDSSSWCPLVELFVSSCTAFSVASLSSNNSCTVLRLAAVLYHAEEPYSGFRGVQLGRGGRVERFLSLVPNVEPLLDSSRYT
jgi:hypothetical protein